MAINVEALLYEYEAFVDKMASDKVGSNAKMMWAAGELAGEVGDISSLVAKQYRKYGSYDVNSSAPAMKLELGDLLFWIVFIANRHGYTVEELMQSNMDKLNARQAA